MALAHDIGHPPFAHAGEEALDREMQRFGERFDHNLHALRIVESFEQRYARFPGLNLTFEVREGIVKHSHDFAPGERPELDEYLPGLRPPLESQLIDLADEIAYNTADLDDAFSAGMLAAEDAAGCVPQYREIHETIEMQFPGATPRERFNETLRQLMDSLVTGLIDGTAAAVTAAGVENADDVRCFPQRLAVFTAAAGDTSRQLKQFLLSKVYTAPELQAGRMRSMALIGELFQFFMDRPDTLPEAYRVQAAGEPLHNVVCGYIAGMTDSFFGRVYSSAFDKLDSSASRTP
jgi:dGTPase